MKARVLPDIFSGNNRCCLAITEPTNGSDVANTQTTAVLSDDGKHFIVNGTKKWITNGVYAEYFSTLVRTGGPDSGSNGLSMLLIERKFGGITTRRMDVQGTWSAGTTFVEFQDVKVPVGNLIGPLGGGFRVLMYNFNR
jgi:alkylation response protein AidB-like acyl-CoA dehydrogenase